MSRFSSIRDGRPVDLAALEALYPMAFPQEDLIRLVRDVVGAGDGVLSLAGVVDVPAFRMRPAPWAP